MSVAKELLSVREAAKELGVSKSAVWKWIREGKIKSVERQFPNRWRIPSEEVQRLKEEIRKHHVKVFSPNGHSLAVRLPKKWCKRMGIKEGSTVLIVEDEGRLVILPR